VLLVFGQIPPPLDTIYRFDWDVLGISYASTADMFRISARRLKFAATALPTTALYPNTCNNIVLAAPQLERRGRALPFGGANNNGGFLLRLTARRTCASAQPAVEWLGRLRRMNQHLDHQCCDDVRRCHHPHNGITEVIPVIITSPFSRLFSMAGLFGSKQVANFRHADFGRPFDHTSTR